LAIHGRVQSAEAQVPVEAETIASIVHELRNPLTAIIGYADHLTDATLAPAERAEGLAIIRQNAEHMLAVVNDILDYASANAGKLTISMESSSPCHVVQEVLNTLRVRAAAKKLELRASYEFPLPAVISTDPLRLRQILINLVGNAVKFTERGTIQITTGLAGSNGVNIRFDVADTGPGIPADQLDRLFKPFSRVTPAGARGRVGTGLGLAISRKLAEALGGQLTVLRSVPGEGSVFRLELPIESLDGVAMLRSVEDVENVGRPARGLERDTPGRVQGRILIIDDDPDIRQLAELVLTEAGAEVACVGDGPSALAEVARSAEAGRPFDYVLTDMQLPGLDGCGIAKSLRQKCFRGRIIAVTGYSESEARQQYAEAGCDAFISKPINWRALARLLVPPEGSQTLRPRRSNR
jgi:CheY-like chemotaxis protein